jgi:energy-coupling factor transporter transmembrane protein EcfT
MTTTHLHLLPLVLRGTQAILSLTSLIFYATALAASPDEDSAYIYALVCCTITLLTLAVYFIPSFPTRKFFVWDFCMAVLWAALSGYFGMIYFNGGDGQEQRGNKTVMEAAVGVDLVVMICWVVSSLLGCVGYCKARLQNRRQRRESREAGKMLEGQENGIVEVEWDDIDEECEKGLMGEKSEKGEKGMTG